MLGLIEDSLTDEIDEVKAITLQVEDYIAYIAVFNKIYYDTLMQQINNLEKPVRFIQSFAFATSYKEKSWTLFLGEEQSFLRTSKFEYYSLDDNRPVPLMLEDLLQTEKPKSLLIYADENYDIDNIAKQYNVPCQSAENQFEYGIPVWNFYIQKSTNFNIKLDKKITIILLRSLKLVKYLAIFLILFWVLSITILFINGIRVKSEISNNLKDVITVNNYNNTTIATANDKISQLKHQRGIYDNTDAVVLLTKFLQIVSTITPNDIKQYSYTNDEAKIIISSNFDISQFESYKNVLKTLRVTASIEDYKTYAKENKNKSEEAKNNINAETQIINDAAWVITLKPSSWHDAIEKK